MAGFLMVAESRWPGEPPYLWRLLIDRRHQGRGIGSRALGLLAAPRLALALASLARSGLGLGPRRRTLGRGGTPAGL